MNHKNEICIGTAGAGRAAELHLDALQRHAGVPICRKRIVDMNLALAQEKQARYGIELASRDFADLLEDEEIDIVDICTPPFSHPEMIEKALAAGKHVICEKPLCGYFGKKGDKEPIGTCVSKAKMYDDVLADIERLSRAVASSGRKFMYAENFVYAPAIAKAAEIITQKKSRILYMKGEESLKGSSSSVAGSWAKTGGGSLIRVGVHPLTAALWLKQVEAKARGAEIKPVSVLADMGRVTPLLSEYEHRHIAARPEDVEDLATVVVKFSDESRAVIMAADTLLGGSKNNMELYCNDAAINCKLTLADMMETYFLDEDGTDDLFISEMLPSKTGWNRHAIADEIVRGYVDEMKDFMEAVYYDREPKSSFALAGDTMKVIYAAYKSAEIGAAVTL